MYGFMLVHSCTYWGRTHRISHYSVHIIVLNCAGTLPTRGHWLQISHIPAELKLVLIPVFLDCMVLCWYTLVHTEEGCIEFLISVHIIVLNCVGTLPTRGHWLQIIHIPAELKLIFCIPVFLDCVGMLPTHVWFYAGTLLYILRKDA